MLWYNILNPRNWPGVTIKTGNNRIDGVYYNLLSSNQVSLAASGSMFLAANSGIQLISPSFVSASGIRCTRILSENFGRINNTGGTIPLYSGASNGLMVKLDDNNLYSINIITYSSGNNELRFPSASDGGVFYSVPLYDSLGVPQQPTKKISSFPYLKLTPESTNNEGTVTSPAKIELTTTAFANNGLSIGPNNFLDSYKGFILTHDGSGNPAQWKPATYLRENYNTSMPLDGLERIGINWIRYPRRPALILNGKLYIYKTNRSWSPYPSFSSREQIKNELGDGPDTLCVTRVKGETTVGYTKFAFTAKAGSQQVIEESFNFDDNISEGEIIDPDTADNSEPVGCWIIDIAPENPGGISDLSPGTNVSIFSVTKGAYFPMQIESQATGPLKLRQNDIVSLSGFVTQNNDGTELLNPSGVALGFKPSTLNNISIRPNIHTAFNMLGEDIDFLIYGKEYTEFNTYNSKFELNDNLVPSGLTPIFKIDANIPNSVKGSPSGVFFSKYTDRQKIKPIGWNFDYAGKICIKTNDAYELASLPSGSGTYLKSYADVTISGDTYTNSLITQDIYLKPTPLANNTGKYIRNALLTLDNFGKIVSRTPRINPTLPDAPKNVQVYSGNGSFTLFWDAPEKDGNSKIINYLVQASADGLDWVDLPIDNAVSQIRGFDSQISATFVVNNLGTINNRIFRVAAQNSVGIGAYSDISSDNYINNLTSPNIPIDFEYARTIDSETLSNIALSWRFNQNMSWGAGPSGFYIEESSFDGSSFTAFSGIAFIDYDSQISEYSYDETGLNGVDNYLYRLTAINNSGINSAYNYIYSTGLIVLELDIEEQENKIREELSNFDFGVIMFTGTCSI